MIVINTDYGSITLNSSLNVLGDDDEINIHKDDLDVLQQFIRDKADILEDGESEFRKPLPYGKNTTICGEDGCDGCLLQHSRDIEACRAEAKRKGFDIESYR